MFGRKKTITLYMVFEVVDGKKTNRLYTITESSEQAEEYIHKLLRLKNNHHYTMWCDCHKMKPEDENSWLKYESIVLQDQICGFSIDEYKYEASQVAIIFRLYNNYTPIGCSYETQFELEKFVGSMDEDTKKKLEEEMAKIEKEKSDSSILNEDSQQ